MPFRKKSAGNVCFFFIAILFASPVFAQVKGKLSDEKGVSIGFANVALMQPDASKPLAISITDSAGRFMLSSPGAGNYFLRITAIGFAELKTEVFTLTNDLSKDLGTITLKADAKKLDDVSVVALRPTITQEPDKLVVTIENTAMAQGNTAYAVLAKSPGVFIDADGNIQLNGRSGVSVMLNGKLTYLSARDLRTLLEGMPAENIKNIEIITNPSSKYDAEGTSGILNINLKKNTQRGMNGSVYANTSYNFYRQTNYGYGGSLNFKGGNWNSFLNIDGGHSEGGRNATFTRIFYGPQTIYFDQEAIGNFVSDLPASIRFGTDYDLNSRHSIGAMAYWAKNKSTDEFLTETYIGNSPKVYQQYIDAANISYSTFNNLTSNIHYLGKLDTLGRQLSADIDFVRVLNRRESDLFNHYTDLAGNTNTTEKLYSFAPAGYDIWSGKIDYVHPLNKTNKLEMGAKISRVESDNDSRFYFNNGSLVLDANRTNYFNYRERIFAAYVNWSGTLAKKLMAQAGLRAEKTDGTGTSYTTGQVNKRDYLDLFPTIFLQHKVSSNYGVNYSYSRRITRPGYGRLNPFRTYRDPYTWFEGNTGLRPQYSHILSIAQTFKKIYVLTATFQFNKDVMIELPILDVNNGTTVYTTGNVDDGHSISLTALAPLRINKKWETQNTVVLNHSRFTMVTQQGKVLNEQLFFMVQSNHTIMLPKNFRAEINLLYRGPGAAGLYHMASCGRVDLAVKKSLFKKKLDVTVNANDVFKSFRYLWTTNIGGNKNDFDQYFRWRNVGVAVRYNFSRGQKVNTKQRSAIEEAGRI